MHVENSKWWLVGFRRLQQNVELCFFSHLLVLSCVPGFECSTSYVYDWKVKPAVSAHP